MRIEALHGYSMFTKELQGEIVLVMSDILGLSYEH